MAFEVHAVYRHPPTLDEFHKHLEGTYPTRARAERACRRAEGVWELGASGPKMMWVRADKIDYWMIKEIP